MASVLSEIKAEFVGLESDAGKFASAFVKLFKKAPTALQAVDNFTNEVAPIITLAVGLAAPAEEPLVAGALAVVETGLGAISASANAAQSGQSLLTNVQNFAATVPALLTGLAIKNPALQSEVTKIVNLVVAESKVLIPAVESWVKQIAAAKASAPAAA